MFLDDLGLIKVIGLSRQNQNRNIIKCTYIYN